MSLAIQVNNSLRVLKRAQAYFAPTTDGRSFADAILPPIFLTSDPPCRSRLESHGSQQTLRWCRRLCPRNGDVRRDLYNIHSERAEHSQQRDDYGPAIAHLAKMAERLFFSRSFLAVPFFSRSFFSRSFFSRSFLAVPFLAVPFFSRSFF